MSSPCPTLTLADLAAWPAGCTGLALLGQPVSHSLSPVIHNTALAELAKDDASFGSWKYAKIEVAPADLQRALGMLHGLGFAGINLTVPHKESVLDLVEGADAFARAARAANTLMRTDTGWRAANTDGGGLADALQQDLGASFAGRDVILLGAGGAARATAVQCLRDHVASLAIGNRGPDRLNELLDHLSPLAGDVALRGFSTAAPPADLPGGAVLINATSLGLQADDPAPIDLRQIPAPAQVYDMIYNPPATALLRQAAALGLPHANGLSMLVQQGARALSLWTGCPAPAGAMHAAARAALGQIPA